MLPYSIIIIFNPIRIFNIKHTIHDISPFYNKLLLIILVTNLNYHYLAVWYLFLVIIGHIAILNPSLPL